MKTREKAPPLKKQAGDGWWIPFYRDFRPIFDLIPRKVTNQQTRYMIEKLDLQPGRRFLDSPCGIGRLALPLAKRGIEVTGVDLQPEYLREVERNAKGAGIRIKLVRSDMRRIEFKSRFDAAANMWTSFGYFRRESDNQLVVNRMFRALKRGGKFLLHLINRDWILRNLQECDYYDLPDLKILERRRFDYQTSIMESSWTYIRDGEERTNMSFLRLYSLHELLHIFDKAGFIEVQSFASAKNEPVTRDSRMLWVVGRKP